MSALTRPLLPRRSKGHDRVFGDGSCPLSGKVGGCLATHWEVWESWGADPWVVQVLRSGIGPPFSPVPLLLPSYIPNSIRRLALATAVEAVLQSLCPGDCMVSLDLQDAYLQVPVHPSSQRYLRFCVGESVFQFRALCFSLSTAPQTFTRHGPGLLDNASSRLPDSPVPQRLACSGLLLSRDRAGEGFPSLALSPIGNTDQHPQELSDSDSIARLFRDDDSDCSFEGFPNPQARSEAVVSPAVFPVRQPPSSV